MGAGPRGEINVTERAFVVELLRLDDGKPADAAEAYERAFGEQKSRRVAAGKAAALLKRQYIKNETNRLVSLQQIAARREASQVKGYVEKTLRGIIDGASSDAVKVNALRELRQLVPEGASDDLSTLERTELIDRIRTLLASQLGLVTEVTVGGGDATEGSVPGGSGREEGTGWESPEGEAPPPCGEGDPAGITVDVESTRVDETGEGGDHETPHPPFF